MGKNRHKPKQRNFLGKIILYVFIIPIVCAFLVYMNSFITRKWKGIGRFTRVFVEESGVRIESFDTRLKTGILFRLPGELEIMTLGGNGRWKINAMKQLESKYGADWARDSIADYLGISVTGGAKMGITDEIAWKRLKNAGHQQELEMNREADMIREIKDVDSEIYFVLGSNWPVYAGKWFLTTDLAAQDTRITIVNTTDTDGLGSHAARAAESAGLKVVMIINEEIGAEGCTVSGNSGENKKMTAIWMMDVYRCKWNEDGTLDSGDYTLRLGSDYRKWWLGEN